MCVLRRSSVSLVIHCAFLRGSHRPNLYSSILVRHSFASLDSWLLVQEGSVLLVDEGVSLCLVMSPANLVVEQVMGRMAVVVIQGTTSSAKVNGRVELKGPYYLTECAVCEKVTSTMAVIC